MDSNRYVDHVDIRIGNTGLNRYAGSLGILLGLADFGKPRVSPPDQETLATVHVRCLDGAPSEPLVLHRKNDGFSILPKSIIVVQAMVNGDGNKIEMCDPGITDIFGHLAAFARIMREVDLELRCGGTPALTFAFCRRGNEIFLSTEQTKPHIIT